MRAAAATAGIPRPRPRPSGRAEDPPAAARGARQGANAPVIVADASLAVVAPPLMKLMMLEDAPPISGVVTQKASQIAPYVIFVPRQVVQSSLSQSCCSKLLSPAAHVCL